MLDDISQKYGVIFGGVDFMRIFASCKHAAIMAAKEKLNCELQNQNEKEHRFIIRRDTVFYLQV